MIRKSIAIAAILLALLIGVTIGSVFVPITLDDGQADIPRWQMPWGILRYEDLEYNVQCWVFVWGERRVAMDCIDGRYLDG